MPRPWGSLPLCDFCGNLHSDAPVPAQVTDSKQRGEPRRGRPDPLRVWTGGKPTARLSRPEPRPALSGVAHVSCWLRSGAVSSLFYFVFVFPGLLCPAVAAMETTRGGDSTLVKCFKCSRLQTSERASERQGPVLQHVLNGAGEEWARWVDFSAFSNLITVGGNQQRV